MKQISVLIIMVCTIFTVHAQNKTKPMDSLSYSLGVLIAQNLKGFENINTGELSEGIQDALKGSPKIDMNKANALVVAYQKEMSKKQYDANLKAGEKFLAENAKKPGVKVLPSGLQYEVMKEGDGPMPKETDQVTTHYHGTLIDGTVFDSSVQRGEPATFPVNGVIQGWVEALQLMKTGSKWKLYIPYQLAYGDRGAGGAIKPFSALIFEVELLKINN